MKWYFTEFSNSPSVNLDKLNHLLDKGVGPDQIKTIGGCIYYLSEKELFQKVERKTYVNN